MGNSTLRQFVSRALASKRISFGDLQRLQRDVLPGGLTSQEEAEALMALDQAVARADPEWPGYLSTVIKDFVLSGPAGRLDRETADWLVTGLLRDRSRTALGIARQIVLEAREADEALVAFLESPKRPGKPVATPPEAPVSSSAMRESSSFSGQVVWAARPCGCCSFSPHMREA